MKTQNLIKLLLKKRDNIDNLQYQIKKNIKDFRTNKGLSTRDMGKLLDCSGMNVSLLERNKAPLTDSISIRFANIIDPNTILKLRQGIEPSTANRPT